MYQEGIGAHVNQSTWLARPILFDSLTSRNSFSPERIIIRITSRRPRTGRVVEDAGHDALILLVGWVSRQLVVATPP